MLRSTQHQASVGGATKESIPCSTPISRWRRRGLEVGFLIRRETVVGAQPGEAGLVVVSRLQQTLDLRPPVQPASAVELGRRDELFQGSDVGGRRDHGIQLVRVKPLTAGFGINSVRSLAERRGEEKPSETRLYTRPA